MAAASERQRLTAAAPQAKQAPLPAEPSLDDYLRYATLHNPGLKAAFERWRAAVERVPQVTALPEPRLTYAYYIEQVETRVGPQRHRIGLMQAFPWFGTLKLRGDAALADARAAAQQLEAARLGLAYRVSDAYCELYYLARAIAITRENTELLKYLESVARSRYRVARGQYADVIRAQVELGKLQDELATLTDLRQPLAARLNAALNRQPQAPVPWPQAVPEQTLDAETPQVLAWMRQASPQLKSLEHEAASHGAAIELARKSRYPDFTIGLSTIETGSARMPTSDSGKDPVIAELSLTLPIWARKYEAAEREARARLESVRHTLADRRNTLAAQVQLALYKLRDAGRRVALYRESLVPRADQALKATQTAYTAGKAALIDQIDAERVLLAFRLALARARVDRAQRLAELDMLVGRPLPRRPAKQQKPEAEVQKKPTTGTEKR
jgi:cobalt-zinc-cadmium efflux system outer membrane protein